MGILFVLIFYLIAMTGLAAIGSLLFRAGAKGLISRRKDRAGKIILIATLFPFACEAFAGAWFVVYAVTNAEVFHRDPGLGDSWETPLPNGYALMMIDTTDQGTVYNPHTQPDGSVVERDDAVFGVRQLQIHDDIILGARDSSYFSSIGEDSKRVDKWFELDTTRKTHIEFASLEVLQREAATQGIELRLREFQSVFSDYRMTWFDYLAFAFLFLTPLTGFAILLAWIWKLCRKYPAMPVETAAT